MTDRLKVFVSAYACEPGLGSEIGVGWHWVLEMSKYFELWVLTRKSNQDNIEGFLNGHPEYRHIRFLYYDLPRWARFWKKGLRGVRTYYNIWQYMTRGIVKQTMRENGIQIFHHLTYGNVVWKVSSYGQKQFFVWGPVGGLEYIDEAYSSHYALKSRIVERIRRTVVQMTRFNIGFRQRCKHANLILCKTEVTRQRLPEKYADKAVLFTDVAADITVDAELQSGVKADGVTRFITVGRLDAWRGFDLVIEALAMAVRENPAIHLTIVGEGADRKRLAGLVERHRLQHYVTMTGKVTMEEYKRQMGASDAVVNAALKEGAVTVSFDSMAMGKPLLCIDTTGYTRYFTDEYAIVIPNTGRDEVICRLKDGMLRLTDAETRKRLGTAARQKSSELSWEHHGRKIKEVIETSYKKYLSEQ